MGYQVKWVQDNLGVSRKALRVFEEEGLMPKNENRKYREYSEDDIDRIWTIRVFQGMGYSLKEIAAIEQSERFDFLQSISEKIATLEAKKEEVERYLGYAQMIKLTGRVPSRPREMGAVKFSDFQENALEGWNVKNVPGGNEAKDTLDTLLNLPEDQWNETEIGKMLLFFAEFKEQLENPERLFSIEVLPRAIIKRASLGANHPEVQLLVKLLYETLCEEQSDITPRQYGRIGSSGYMEGDIGLLQQKKYGTEGCAFLADAIAVFGGFIDYEDSMQY